MKKKVRVVVVPKWRSHSPTNGHRAASTSHAQSTGAASIHFDHPRSSSANAMRKLKVKI